MHSALNRKESRGAHQRLDGFEERDDVNFLKHTLAYYTGDGPPRIEYGDGEDHQVQARHARLRRAPARRPMSERKKEAAHG